MALHPQLLEILACPDAHHTPLVYDEPGQTLTCPECERVYPINDGLPELLLEDAGRDEVTGAGLQDEAPRSGEARET